MSHHGTLGVTETQIVVNATLTATRYALWTARYARTKAKSGEVIGWENIELISDRPLEVMLEDFVRLKREYVWIDAVETLACVR